MLTRDEQEEILRRVRDLISHSKALDTRTRCHEISKKTADAARAAMMESFKDFLKEVG